MHKKLLFHTALTLFVFVSGAFAQIDDRKIEVGGFLTHLNLTNSNGEGPVGVGGRFGYNFSRYVGFDAEIAHLPENGQGAFGQTVALAGVKAGVRTRKVGVFAKVRPGFVHFGGSRYEVFGNDQPTKFALDVGGVIEYCPTPRSIIRVDAGDTIIAFGNDRFPSGTPNFIYQPGTSHNFQGSIGVGFRF